MAGRISSASERVTSLITATTSFHSCAPRRSHERSHQDATRPRSSRASMWRSTRGSSQTLAPWPKNPAAPIYRGARGGHDQRGDRAVE
eukprot:15012597-Alexandrium_andersonii.AAC.1